MVKLKVIDFNPHEFEAFLEKTFHDKDLISDKSLVLGIEEGGKPLAKMLHRFLSQKFENIEIDIDYVKCQRPSTKLKKRNPQTETILKSILKILPKKILNYWRIQEHQRLMKKQDLDSAREVIFDENILWNMYSKIWIVDDAVDSGTTLASVVEAVKSRVGECISIKTLVVVTTSHQAKIKPDFSLYQQVLVRFPWSLDG